MGFAIRVELHTTTQTTQTLIVWLSYTGSLGYFFNSFLKNLYFRSIELLELIMRVKFAIIFFALWCFGFTPKSIANELDNAAACSGVVLGNASIDYSLGDEASFNEGVTLAITAYLSEVLQSPAEKENIAIADQILATNTDKIINAANTETFDANVYEEVVKCYRRVATLLLKNRKIIETNRDKINLLITQRIKLLKRILSAG